MSSAFLVLFRVAEELAELARSSLPKLRDGERIKREWLDNGIYHRETVFRGETFLARFDLKQRKSL